MSVIVLAKKIHMHDTPMLVGVTKEFRIFGG